MDKLGLDLYAAMVGVKNPDGERGGNLAMRKLMMASQPKIFRGQRGAGLFSIFTRPLARLFCKKVTKQAAKAVAKRVAKKVTKEAATGAVTAGASWATQKALDHKKRRWCVDVTRHTVWQASVDADDDVRRNV